MTWNREAVKVTARVVPKYAFTTASIDVEVGDRLVLATGGVLKFVGSQTRTYERNGKIHTVEVNWGVGKFRSFPVTLLIDGELLFDSNVKVSNWWVMYWPLLAIFGFVLVDRYFGIAQ